MLQVRGHGRCTFGSQHCKSACLLHATGFASISSPPPPLLLPSAQAAGEAEAALFRLRTLLAHVVTTGRHGGHRPGARPSSGAALACLDELQQLLKYLQVRA